MLHTLQTVPLFRTCSDRELQRIATLGSHLEADTGDILLREGAPGSEFFVIVDGVAEVTVAGSVIATLRSGDFFGEMALLDRRSRSATVRATTPMTLIDFDEREFSSLLEDSPTVGRAMLGALARRMRDLYDRHPRPAG